MDAEQYDSSKYRAEQQVTMKSLQRTEQMEKKGGKTGVTGVMRDSYGKLKSCSLFFKLLFI